MRSDTIVVSATREGLMARYRWALAMVVSVVLVSVAPQANGADGVPIPQCEQVVTTNAYLVQDLSCAGLNGIFVGGDGITIDLRGFTLSGDRTHDRYGISNSGFDKVTIKNGVVRNFEIGVYAWSGADNLTLSGLVSTGSIYAGVVLDGNAGKIKSVIASGNGAGVYLEGSFYSVQSAIISGNYNRGIKMDGLSNSIKASVVAGNGLNGIEANGDSASVTASTVTGNEVDGIRVRGNAASVTKNRVYGNGFPGGVSNLAGLGINVTDFPNTPPTGKNIAQGNDDPAECVPAYLC
jgi:Periplasmic copper-binding protein (NosD)